MEVMKDLYLKGLCGNLENVNKVVPEENITARTLEFPDLEFI